ncbi:MAG: hypothetical protein NZO58_10650 [Gemmataceae bacterium]|nr:hypothetical protein [Gemmataceae bacterium]
MSRRFRSVVALGVALGSLTVAVAWQSMPPAESQPRSRALLPVMRDATARFWKGNLHTHSLWSDGDDFPEMIADWYQHQGYHFLALTDHNVLSEGEKWIDLLEGQSSRAEAVGKYRKRFGSAWVETRRFNGKEQVRLKPLAEFRSLLEQPGRFLLIPGEEITHRFQLKPVHVNAINLRDVIAPAGGTSVGETIRVNVRAVAEQRKKTGRPMLAFLNHPNFGWGVRAEDLLIEELRYFEVYNGHPSVRNYGDEIHPSSERLWDIALALRLGRYGMPPLLGLGTDDAHAYHEWGIGKTNPGRGWIMVRAPFLTAEAIVKGIETGDYYVSTGVILDDVIRTKRTVQLRIRGEKGVAYKTEFIATLRETPLASQPQYDKDGKELDVTRRYHPEIGKTVAVSTGLEPSYEFTGKERYVRARVTSSRPHPNPYAKGDVEMAWTQPMLPE